MVLSTKMLCSLNTSLTWLEALIRAESNYIKNILLHHSTCEILEMADQVRSEFCISCESLPVDHRSAIVDILIESFPIIHASKSNQSVLIDVQELFLDKDCFMQLLSCDEKEISEPEPENDEGQIEAETNTNNQVYGPKRRIRRKPLHEKFPTLVPCATEFIKGHSFQAHGRRRETTGTGGVLLSPK